jgi:hypothetical protein
MISAVDQRSDSQDQLQSGFSFFIRTFFIYKSQKLNSKIKLMDTFLESSNQLSLEPI